MKAAQLGALWRAETLKLFSRGSARLGLGVAVALSVLATLTLWQLSGSQMILNGASLESLLAENSNAPTALRWGLHLRNFFVIPAFVILLSAQSLAGELQARTLREELLRPVPRWAVLVAKWAALATWSAATLGLSWVVGAAGGMALLGTSGPWAEVGLGYVACLLCDVGLAAVSLAVAITVQGVAGSVVGTFLFLVLTVFLGWGLFLLSWVAGIEALRASAADWVWLLDGVVRVEPWLPPAALRAWSGVSPEADWVWQSFVALALLIVVSLGVAERRLATLDVP